MRLFLVGLACAVAGCAADDPADDDANPPSDGKADGLSFSAVETRAILKVANEASIADLKSGAGLSAATAAAIDAHRIGADRKLGTSDDDLFDSLAELDAVSGVTPAILDQLVRYARQLGWLVDHRLPGFDETMLVGDSGGALAVVRVGETFQRRAVTTRTTQAPIVARSDGQKFFLLYASGSLAIVDPTRAVIERTVRVPSSPGGFEWGSASTIYVSRRRAGTIVELDLSTGATRRTIDLAALRIGTGTIEPRQMYRLGEHLFVEVARQRHDGVADRGAVAVVNTTSGTVEKVLELELRNPTTGTLIAGLEPDFPMVWDARRDLLMVTARGNRPSDTGMFVRIDTNTLTIHDAKRADSGFQGAVAMAAPFTSLFMLYHTSTPTSSTHMFVFDVDAAGTLTQNPGTLVDAFDELDAIAVNDDGTLAVMANACFAGVCPQGSGLSFIDVRTRQRLPKLMADQLGLAPELVVFR